MRFIQNCSPTALAGEPTTEENTTNVPEREGEGVCVGGEGGECERERGGGYKTECQEAGGLSIRCGI